MSFFDISLPTDPVLRSLLTSGDLDFDLDPVDTSRAEERLYDEFHIEVFDGTLNKQDLQDDALYFELETVDIPVAQGGPPREAVNLTMTLQPMGWSGDDDMRGGGRRQRCLFSLQGNGLEVEDLAGVLELMSEELDQSKFVETMVVSADLKTVTYKAPNVVRMASLNSPQIVAEKMVECGKNPHNFYMPDVVVSPGLKRGQYSLLKNRFRPNSDLTGPMSKLTQLRGKSRYNLRQK